MSLIKEIVAAIQERETATLDDLTPMFPHFSRQQVKQALHNASFNGLVGPIERGPSRGRHKGRKPSVFAAIKRSPRVNSVFQLGAV